MRKSLLSLSLCALSWGSSMAATDSWYIINNYQGMIGKSPVHVSLQSYAFGGKTTMKGSYYYDKYRAPIPLYGSKTADSIVLCEVNGDKEYRAHLEEGGSYDLSACPLQLSLDGNDLKGTWQGEKSNLNVVLHHTDSLDAARLTDDATHSVDIPFWGQTATHSFIGVYEKKGDDIAINKVKVLNKSSGNVDQIIDPQLHDCTFGFYMTAIYQNIEKMDNPSQIALNCYSTGSDQSVMYQLNKESHTYSLLP